MNRRGISSVVANVLIVLLVIVGVGILWAAVRPLISSSNNRVQPDCFTIDLDVMECDYMLGTGGNPGSAQVVVKRGVGAGDVRAVKFAFSYETGSPTVSDEFLTPGFDELATITKSVSGITSAPKSVVAVAMVGPEKVLCGITGTHKECV